MGEECVDNLVVNLRNFHVRVGMRAMIRSQELAGDEVDEGLRRRCDEIDKEQTNGEGG